MLLFLLACAPPTGDSASPEVDTAAVDSGDAIVDADGDGSPAFVDCDDADATVAPDQDEVCGDGRDNDCDGTTLGCRLDAYLPLSLETAAGALLGAREDAYLGSNHAIGGIGDINGDGYDDYAVGAMGDGDADAEDAGRAYVVLGPPRGPLSTAEADAVLLGEDAGDWFGGALVGGADATGDGAPDLVVGARQYAWYNEEERRIGRGAVYVFASPTSGSTSAADAWATIEGWPDTDGFGASLALSDLDGDGAADLVVGATHGLRVYAGPIAAGVSTADGARLRLWGPETGDAVAAGDLDGDGLPEIVTNAPWDATAGGSSGALYVTPGGLEGDWPIAIAADAVLYGEPQSDVSLYDLDVGDLDDDGYADIVTGSYTMPVDDLRQAGTAYVVRGPVTTGDLADAPVKLRGSGAYERVGRETTLPGDLDGDGRDDLAVGVHGENRTWIFYAPVRDGTSSADVDVLIEGSSARDELGGSIAGAGDTNGDGYDDLLLGAPAYDSDLGIVWLVLGAGW